MLRIHPFQALRPSPARARAISCERLDHLTPEVVGELATRAPGSVAALLQDPAGGEAIGEHLTTKALIQEPGPTMYMHRQVRGGRRIAGVAALLEASALAEGSLRSTREACPARSRAWRSAQHRAGAQLDPVIVGFPLTEMVQDLLEREMNDRPLFHVLADDGATHTFWRGCRSAELAQAFERVERGYVLEGHGRAAHSAMDGMLMCLLVPLESVLPHWSVLQLHGETAARMSQWLAKHGAAAQDPGEPPTGWADACVAGSDGARWFRGPLPPPRPGGSPVDLTDLGRVQELMRSVAGTQAPGEVRLVPGDAHPSAVERIARGGVAVVLPRPAMAELTAVTDQGCLLPQGSTWFEPRIRSGLWLRRTTMPE
jgi:hypothetical protein